MAVAAAVLASAAAVAVAGLSLGVLPGTSRATGDDLSQLQSELNANNAQQSTLAGSVAALSRQIDTLNSQVALVQSREASVHAALAAREAALARAEAAVTSEQHLIARLAIRLKQTQATLAAELVSRYEQPQQSLISVVIESHGFQQMLDQLQFMQRANDEEQSIIRETRRARAAAQSAKDRLTTLERADRQAAAEKLTQARALAGMQTLLSSRRAALAHVEAAHNAALAASREQGAALQSAIDRARQQEQDAQQLQGGSDGDAYDGWAIPEAIVMCESGGQNLPPNSAGASGYYQIIPSTWKGFGGTTAQAYQASRSEQDTVAARIWDGGAGASNWACSAIVGIT